ncbi:hypothetical protein KAFR_0B04060 [Kazachstania africana CBS 2517]|uniref:phosphoserine phosphatase n=1 Tax=Kazachstania africana (strain ATCC 22294 / BCRC 22015 / CBS 2517 / CECT 1963 / NBRC 1671 / NRRL Y-8276) TaxID=1071382 RepID=H2AQQ2_KAZAF|nr:hypothetical protein KAFR_0B04060 [Kazachstania africana CBS 2517]CCF56702.1 hypothetical protein KAFR_0B04060 [Kazachstania africana CBS 2517]
MQKFVITVISHGDILDIVPFEKTISKECNIVKTIKLSSRSSDIHVESVERPQDIDTAAHDVIIQKDDEYRRNKKLVVFDMDSTLIYQEVIELIAAYANVEDKVRSITNRAMNNEIDFKESLKERVALLKGIRFEDILNEIKDKLVITEGVTDLCHVLKEDGVHLAVLSGGFIEFAEVIKKKLNLDVACANVLERDSNGILTGKLVNLDEIVDGEFKANKLLSMCKELNVPVKSSVMIGDGGNDLPAMSVAGFGVAWNAKPIVQMKAPSKLNTKSLSDVLYIFGYTQEEINEKRRH